MPRGKDAARPPGDRRCCAIGHCCQDRLSQRTVRDVRDTLGSAVAEVLVTRNVAAIVRLPVSRKRKRNWWSVEEARAVLESARTDRDPLYAAYVLVLVLGLRRGETALKLRGEGQARDGQQVRQR